MKKIIRYSPEAERWLINCAPIVSKRIVDKIEYFANQENLYKYAKKLQNSSLYRFRVGHYRIIFRQHEHFLDIILIGKRDDVYHKMT